MASIKYARMALRIAGEQVANRTVVVVRHAPPTPQERARAWLKREGGGINPTSQVPMPEVRHLGEVTPTTHEYSGPPNRTVVDDPHEAAVYVVLVEQILAEHPEWRAVFEHCYVHDRYAGSHRRADYELCRAVAARLPNDEEESIAGVIQLELVRHRLKRMEAFREKDAARQKARREARKTASTNFLAPTAATNGQLPGLREPGAQIASSSG